MGAQQTLNEIQQITRSLIELSLCEDQNFPATTGSTNGAFEIDVKNSHALTTALKNVAYGEIYRELLGQKCFNILLIDGALLVFRYRFSNNAITEHNLGFFPSPDLEQFQNEPEIYLEDLIYADIVAKNVVTFPIRFDYSDDTDKFTEVEHPYSHVTFGQYKNCRIPVTAPLSPIEFCQFILRNFYNTAFSEYSKQIPTSTLRFGKTIADSETVIPHFSVPHELVS